MNLLEALWKSDGRKKPNEADIEALYQMIQANEKTLGEEKTLGALLALARFGSLLGFPVENQDMPSTLRNRTADQFLDVQGVCELLKVSPRHVKNLMNRRVLPYFKLGRSIRFRLSAVLQALDAYQIKGRSFK